MKSNFITKEFNGVEVLDEPIETLVSIVRHRIIPRVSYIVTPNADHFFRLSNKKNQSFIDAYKNADIRVCDSRIIQKLSVLESSLIRNVVPGSDLTRSILEAPWVKDCELLLIGPDKEDAEVVKSKFLISKMKSYTPPMGFIHDEFEILRCIDIISKTQPDIVFIAVGSPQQEILANRIKRSVSESYINSTVILCVGASFDFLSGKIKRAPVFMQAMHLEWLHRALSNPIRLIPRYWNNFLWILSYIFKKLWKLKLH